MHYFDAFALAQERIDECLSDHIVKLAERYDLGLPACEEGPYWEAMHYEGDRLILTTLGREVTREKIANERKRDRELWSFILSLVATFGSLTIAALAIYFRK